MGFRSKQIKSVPNKNIQNKRQNIYMNWKVKMLGMPERKYDQTNVLEIDKFIVILISTHVENINDRFILLLTEL